MTNSNVAYMSKNFSVFKWIVGLAVLGAAVVGFQIYQQYSFVLRIVALVALVGVSLGIIATTSQGQAALAFIKAAKAEAKRVVWPGRQETLQTTGIVVVMVLIATLFLWLVDSILILIMSWFTG